MKTWSFRAKLIASLGVVLSVTNAVAIACALAMHSASGAMSDLAEAQLPELALATAFEREILNARIFFIYHVTIQKPGTLEQGWERMRNAQALAPQLTQQVEDSAALAALREPTRQLRADLERYIEVLNRILSAVEKHENGRPEFKDLIAEWAAAGGRLVNDASDLQKLCDEKVIASSHDQARILQSRVIWGAACSVLSVVLGVLIGWWLSRITGRTLGSAALKLKEAVEQIISASRHVAPPARVWPKALPSKPLRSKKPARRRRKSRRPRLEIVRTQVLLPQPPESPRKRWLRRMGCWERQSARWIS